MVGNIGTGKTTTTTKLMAQMNNSGPRNTLTVSNDELATMLSNKYYGPSIWTSDYIQLYSTIKQYIVQKSFSKGFNIIVDGTHMSKIGRKKYIDIAKEFNAEVIVYLHTSPYGLERRIAAPKSIHTSMEKWIEIYNNFDISYEIPTLDEGINNIIEVEGI